MNRMQRPARQQEGFTLVAVIFLIVVLGGALALMATLSIQSSGQVSQNLLQSRARLAAQAALQWATQQLVTDSDQTTLCSNELQNTAVPVLAYPTISVTLDCQQRQYHNSNIHLFDLSARAEYGQLGAADYVWTEQHATLEIHF